MKQKLPFIGLLILLLCGCGKKEQYYTMQDFVRIDKVDIHFHYVTTDPAFVRIADSLRFRLLSPNVDAGVNLDSQLLYTSTIRRQFQEKFAFFGTFSVDSFRSREFATMTIDRIKKCIQQGATGIKIWKNIGMTLKNGDGSYVMADDPAFDPIYSYLESAGIPLMAHLGEPRNCWLPEKEMTVDNDKRYFSRHPEYHMYLHPEAPTYESQIAARDHLLQKHPNLHVIGAHLGSLEWNVDEVARRLDKYPNLDVDLSARLVHLQHQSNLDRERVRNFLIKYKDRILYGTDAAVGKDDTNYRKLAERQSNTWRDHWAYLATDSAVTVRDLGNQKVTGLKLPREVIDRIFTLNAAKYFINVSFTN